MNHAQWMLVKTKSSFIGTKKEENYSEINKAVGKNILKKNNLKSDSEVSNFKNVEQPANFLKKNI